MKWRINFYHTEAMYRGGIVSFSYVRTGSRDSLVNEAKNLARARGDYSYEIIPE